MSKTLKFIITLFLTITILAACNTEQESTETDSATGSAHTEGKEVNESVDTEEPTTEEGNKVDQTSKETDTESTISFSSNGESKTAELSKVDGEQYSIQVIPGFSLTPEEPGKDVLYYDEDDSINMRIEAMTTDDSTFDDLVANTEETMGAISQDYEQYDIADFVGDYDLENSTAYIANLDSEEVITVVFEKANNLVRLTIFDRLDVDLSEAMIKMGLTIE
ncbi:hypothetical protein [Ureibacillus sinduriensis]|uniref:Lipoprotein n=1 Tax=Ureibacillus sinduriensis BLB-1 = JCM 15800 TaxID=1384057 RepID=A0A0A3HR70_9BACL|nr:hypothetical protein [Ureibacillus sinduriensis]KGR73715.1 hypothetical protein CD33_16995 [Ureibacillus sinduriensis BLB-1 = JCM 15800]